MNKTIYENSPNVDILMEPSFEERGTVNLSSTEIGLGEETASETENTEAEESGSTEGSGENSPLRVPLVDEQGQTGSYATVCAAEEESDAALELPTTGTVREMLWEDGIFTVEDGMVYIQNLSDTVTIGGVEADWCDWHQEEPAAVLDEPYLKEWGYQCCKAEDEENQNGKSVSLYKWLYRCMKEGFTVPTRTIKIEGAGKSYVCTVDGGSIAAKLGEKWDDPAARILNIPLVQFRGLNGTVLKHMIWRVKEDNPDLCFPLFPQSIDPMVKYENDADGMENTEEGYLYLYSVFPTEEKRAQMQEVCEEHIAAIQDKVYSLYGIKPTDTLTVDQKVKVAKVIHDYLILHGSMSAGELVAWWSPMMISVFDARYSGLCAGYTQAFNYAARTYGIESLYMSGTAHIDKDNDAANTYETDGGHAWVALRLSDEVYGTYPGENEKWTCIDVLWDEPEHEASIGGTPEREDILWKYFMNIDNIFPKEGSEQYDHAYREITTTGGYGNNPMDGNPSLSMPYSGNEIYVWNKEE